jgi:hypothetical protein
LIFLGPERMANEAINCALYRSVVVPALGLQEPFFDQTIDLRVV